MTVKHYSVLKNEVIEFFKQIETDKEYILDATVGGGGHSYLILKNFLDKKVIGLDKDEYALKRAEERLKEFKGRYILIKSAFKDLDNVLESLKIEKLAGVLFDFGVSHFQLKLERGFSFLREEPLDMRMDTSQDLTAYHVVNYYPKWQIEKILREYGEEKFAKRIAENIVKERKKSKIETTKQLADIVYKSYPKKLRYKKIHPATKTFQAIRIEVNKELEEIEEALHKAIDKLDTGGIIQAISFHSLEDRIVKNIFKEYKKLKKLKILTKKPITPSKEEINENPASRSAKLRVGKKI